MTARAIENTCRCGHYRVHHDNREGACRECDCEGFAEAAMPEIVHQHERAALPPKLDRVRGAHAVLEAATKAPAPAGVVPVGPYAMGIARAVAANDHAPVSRDIVERAVRAALHLAIAPCGCASCERAAIREVDGNMTREAAITLTVMERV